MTWVDNSRFRKIIPPRFTGGNQIWSDPETSPILKSTFLDMTTVLCL